MVEIQDRKKLSNIINIYFKFSKNWIRFILISNTKHKTFQINLTMELFTHLMLKLLELILNFYSLGITFLL